MRTLTGAAFAKSDLRAWDPVDKQRSDFDALPPKTCTRALTSSSFFSVSTPPESRSAANGHRASIAQAAATSGLHAASFVLLDEMTAGKAEPTE